MNDGKERDRLYRVLIVDDHPHGREGMRDILELEPAFAVVGEAASGEAALEEAKRLAPDLVLMDINMPGMGGLEATRRLKAHDPNVKIVMVTVEDDITFLFEALKRGAQGYLLKNLNPAAWHEYLRAVACDEAPMTKELAHRLLREFSEAADAGGNREAGGVDGAGGAGGAPGVGMLRHESPGDRPLSKESDERRGITPLTPREREILERVALGESNREVAAAFGLSEHTVKNHLKNILQKLHLDNRVQLTRYALEQGWVDRPAGRRFT